MRTNGGPIVTVSFNGSRNWWKRAVPLGSDGLFRALADPTRRRILDLLAEHGTLTVGQLAGRFPELVSSGISKHLMGLRAVRLVTATRRGRERLYRINAETMTAALEPWLEKYRPYLSSALDRLRELAEAEDRHR